MALEPASTAILRRNGKLGSCEPCRKSKLKCDHTTPVCGKCRKKGLESQCFYHPAPLTSERSKEKREKKAEIRQIRPRGQCPVQHAFQPLTPRTTPRNDGTTASPAIPATPASLPPHDRPSLFSEANQSLDISFCGVGPFLLERLEALPILESLFDVYFNTKRASFMSCPLIMPAVTALRRDLAHLRGVKSLAEISVWITQNTRKPFVVPADTTPEDFYKLFTGENLRWDFIGVVFAWAGLCTYVIPLKATTVILSGLEAPLSSDLAEFSKEMVASSNHCISLCQECDAVTTLSLWLLYANSLLLCNALGDGHPLVWRRGGEISTEIFALGIHKSPATSSDVPFFLDHARKRVFAGAYKSDKLMATFLNRPPRIPRQYCDFRLPLDLSDEDACLKGPALQAAIDKLDAHGWNTEQQFHAVTWQRARYQISIFREELLELSFLNNETSHTDRLISIAQDLDDMWASFPPHVKYTEAVWTQYDARTCIYSIATYLDYLHSVFTTERLLSSTTPSVRPRLLRTCTHLLSTVIVLTKQRTLIEDFEISRDLPWFLLYFGLPSAGVLTKEIRKSSMPGGESLPGWLKRVEVVRNLSVLVTYLDWFGGIEGRYTALSKEGSKKLGVELDEVIRGTEMAGNGGATVNGGKNSSDGEQQGGETVQPSQPVSAESHVSEAARAVAQPDGSLGELHDFADSGMADLMPLGDDMGTDSTFLNWLDNIDWNSTSVPTF